MRHETMPTEEVLAEIERYQGIMKQRRPGTPLWNDCQLALKPLFKEMARRMATKEETR